MVLKKSMIGLIETFLQDEDGQGIIEYAFILIFIALSVIIALPSLGTSVVAKFQSINEGLQ